MFSGKFYKTLRSVVYDIILVFSELMWGSETICSTE